MNPDSLDDVTRILATPLSRRRLLQGLGGTVAGGLLAGLPLTISHAAPPAAPPAVDLPSVQGLANAPNFELLGEVPASAAARAATGVSRWRVVLRRGVAPVIRITGVGPNRQARVIVVLITDQRARLYQLFELRPAFGGVVVRNQDVFHIGPTRNTEQQRLFDLLAKDLETQPIVEAARPCRRAIIRAVAACLAAGALCQVTGPGCIAGALVCVDRIADAIEACDDGGP